MGKWSIWIDTGGTFTDCIAVDPGGEWHRVKVLSTGRLRARLTAGKAPDRYRLDQQWRIRDYDIFQGYRICRSGREPVLGHVVGIDPDGRGIRLDRPLDVGLPLDVDLHSGEEAPVLAARLITGTALDKDFPELAMRLGSTRGTNALLERRGAKMALLITRGFTDLPLIGNQQRPNLFQLAIPPPESLADAIWAVDERLDAGGEVLEGLREESIRNLIDTLRAAGVESVAIALMHAYRNPGHEQRLAENLRAAGISFISCSSDLAPEIKLLPRARTTLVNAYLDPVIASYLSNIRQSLGGQAGRLRVMTSAGGLVAASQFAPKDSLLSGPAGGVVGAARIAAGLGYSKVLTLDMGGTSADTARYDGYFDYRYLTTIDGFEIMSPALAIETVAAGGGSICGFDGEKLFVGPQSAGASPGPACYGAGGPLTITDVNLLLGKLDPEAMGIPVSPGKAREALDRLCEAISAKSGQAYRPAEVLRGLEQIADEKMADAIRRISVARGFDPKEYALLAFGGAGGLHACSLAELLDIQHIILPFDAGLLSAYGMGCAHVERFAAKQVLKPLEACRDELPHWIRELEQAAKEAVREEGFSEQETERAGIRVSLRFQGQESPLEIRIDRPAEARNLPAAFEKEYRSLFGHYPEGRTIELVSIRVRATSRASGRETFADPVLEYIPDPARAGEADGTIKSAPVFFWNELRPGARVKGPAILLSPFATAYVAKGWSLRVEAGRNIVAHREKTGPDGDMQQKEAVELELFTNRFTAIAEEMGAQLQRTAFSVNIKERLDFSCALLDAECRLLVNAPHIPVHLGSLGICARLVREKLPLGPGDVVITNHPKYGGSHLPDITLLAAVFDAEGNRVGYVINRAHHAEMGGTRPGSMPPDATRLEDEGVAIPPSFLVRSGQVRWEAMRQWLTGGPWPSRAPEENLADINAALASLRSGEKALLTLVGQHGREKVMRYMDRLRESARMALATALRSLEGKRFSAQERLDDGRAIVIQASVDKGRLCLDLTGTGAVHPHNLNANISIVYSAVMYVLRLLCGQEIPLNDGLMEHVDLILPENTFLHPAFADDPADCPAVVGGNTEVSQRLVDTLLKAFGLAACSQGTMNNFLFGNERFGYYETIGGGAGAVNGHSGRSAVHQHMTNTRITDPEDLEFRYPVRLNAFSIRRGSGGTGRWPGGDGIVREVLFLEPMEVTLLSQHRVEAPYGMEGGSPGATGRQEIIRADGTREPLGGMDSASVSAGDAIRIETPGGGGFSQEGVSN